MAEPVVFDDGGSTRIRQLNNFTMDGLLGLVVGAATVFRDSAAVVFQNGVGNFSCLLRVRHHDPDGAHHVKPNAAGMPLLVNDTVTITSQNGQVTTLTFDAATFLMTVALSASPAGIDPIVEARQNNNQRRYIVSNAGPIQSVVVTRAGAPTTVYPQPGVQPSIYTMVHLIPA